MSKIILKSFPLLRKPFDTFDPFLFCMHHHDIYPAGDAELCISPELLTGRSLGNDFSYKDGWSMYHGYQLPGFPAHPHSGFETITITIKGLVDHSDSLNCTARYGDGDTQWMTAGIGIQHAEMFPLVQENENNVMELIQVWLNLPKVNKLCPPGFKMMWHEETPVYMEKNTTNGLEAKVKIIAGSFKGIEALQPPPNSWASNPNSGVAVWVISIPKNGFLQIPPAASSEINRTIYFFSGEKLKISHETEEEVLEKRTGARVISNITFILEAVEDDVEVLILQGRPIGEPVVQQGPFVMNTSEEIAETIARYHKTDFGGWNWGSEDHHHPRDTPRHALHPSGEKEFPPTDEK